MRIPRQVQAALRAVAAEDIVTGWKKAPGCNIRDEAVKSAAGSSFSRVQRSSCGLARAGSPGGDGAAHVPESRELPRHGRKLLP